MDFPIFQLPYMILAVDKMDGHGLSNTAHHECLTTKARLMVCGLAQPTLLYLPLEKGQLSQTRCCANHRKKGLKYLGVRTRSNTSVIKVSG